MGKSGKAFQTVLLIVLLTVSTMGVGQRTHQTQEDPMILADTIAKSLWTIEDWDKYATQGILFGKRNYQIIPDILHKYNSSSHWKSILNFARMLEYLNYSSTLLNNTIKIALDGAPLNSYALPISTDNGYSAWHFTLLNGFRYAQNLSYNTTKWNTTKAIDGLIKCRGLYNRSFYACDADNNVAKSLFHTRWMNTANLAKAFLLLYNVTGDQRALDYAFQEWEYFNDVYWDPARQAYLYSTDWKIWEWSTIEVFFNYELLYQLNGTLKNWDRVYKDLENRYLVNEWNAPLWETGMILHSGSSSQRRVHGTLDAWQLLHAYYSHFTNQSQKDMRNMLEGNNGWDPAWELVLQPGARVYDPETYLFRRDSDGSYSYGGTLEGATLLFLLGISPQYGQGLAMPRYSEGYSGGFFPIHSFRFLYSRQEVVIPVHANTTLKFMYGTEPSVHTFDDEGLYHIKFDSTWNNILWANRTNIAKIQNLDLEPQYDFTYPMTTSSTTTSSMIPTTPTFDPSPSTSTTSASDEHSSTSSSSSTLVSSIPENQSTTESTPFSGILLVLQVTFLMYILWRRRRFRS